MDDALIKVLLVDDHEMVRIGLAAVLGPAMVMMASG
jgi:NarL family two-component system response regulator LiaR